MKNKKVYGLVGVAALAAIGGTFAYYSAEQTFTNPFNTTNYGSQATEKFNPNDGDEWKPGAEVDKDVYATNTGDGDVWVRVKFDEVWTRGENPLISISAVGENGEYNSDFDLAEATAPEGNQPGTDGSDGTKDGLVNKDKTVVYKNYANIVELNAAKKGWIRGGDGYYYYNVALTKADPQSAKLLDSVTLAKNADMGNFIGEYAYLTVKKNEDGSSVYKDAPIYPNPKGEWTLVDRELDLPVLPVKTEEMSEEDYKEAVAEFNEKYGHLKGYDIYTYKASKLNETAQGYANADYNLNITVEFVQADEEAAQGWDSDIVKMLVEKQNSTTPSVDPNPENPDSSEGSIE